MSDDSLVPEIPEIPTPKDAEELLNHIEELLDKTYDMCMTKNTTIQVKDELHRQLAMLKYKYGFKSFEDMLRVMALFYDKQKSCD